MKPFRGKRRGPQSSRAGFNPRAGRRSFDAHASRQRVGGASVARGRTFGARSATTGSPAVRSDGERWPTPRRRCYNPHQQWPVGGPRETRSRGRREGRLPCGRSTWGDCRQCPLTAIARRVGFSAPCSASVANRSVTCPTRLETRTKESNMCASRWVLRNPRAQ